MYRGQCRRSPGSVANGTRGPHRGQGQREMKRGVNSLRQALRPQTSPIDTHSRGSCHCPIDRNQSLPMLTSRHAEDLATVLSYLAGWISARKRSARRWSFRGRPSTTTGEGDIGYRGPTCARPRRTWVPAAPNPERGSWLSPFSPPSPSLRLVEPVKTSVSWRCRWEVSATSTSRCRVTLVWVFASL